MSSDTQSTRLYGADDRRLKEVIDAIPAGLLVASPGGQILMTNRELEHLFGYSGEEMLGKPVEMLFSERCADQAKLQRGYVLGTRGRRVGTGKELFGLRKDGMKFPLEIGVNPVETDAGAALVATVSDTSVKTRLESNFRQMVEASPVGKLMVDRNGTIQMVNAKLCQLFGYEENELVGEALETLLPYNHRNDHVALRKAFLEEPSARAMGTGRDLTGLRKDGSKLAVEVGLNPLEAEDGMAVVAAVTDISERKKLERHLRTLNEDLDEFTAVASHDLRAPLRGVADLAEWIAEDISQGCTPDALDKLARIRLRVRRMEQLIDDLLEYARAGRATNDFQDISLQGLLDEIARFVEVPERFDIKLRSEIGQIHSPRTPLETVLRNLISNAVKHHDREHGCIQVEMVCEGSLCKFSISDDGPGIPGEARERIFKLSPARPAHGAEHAGVGLAISKRLIESYGGRLEVAASEQQRGTVFRFDWPCAVVADESSATLAEG